MDICATDIRPPTDAEIPAFTAAKAPDASEDMLRDELMRAIPELPADAFKADGVPKLPDLRKAVPDADPKAITAELVDEVMKVLVKGGFKAPVAAA